VQLIGFLLAAMLVLALLRMTVIALCVCVALFLLWAAVMRPWRLIGMVLFGVVCALAEAYPAITLCLLTAMTITYVLGNN
jgi:hypothetical protein